MTHKGYFIVLGSPTSQQAPTQQPIPRLPFPPGVQHMPGSRPPFVTWPSAAVSSGIPTASVTVSAIRGAQPYNSTMTPMMVPPVQSPAVFPRPSISSPGNTSWSANVVNRMKPEPPKSRGPSPLDLLGQEALTAHKESQSRPKVEDNSTQPLEKKDALLLDIGDSVSPQPTPSIPPPTLPPPPSAVPTSNGQKANDIPLDQISLTMDAIKPGKIHVPYSVHDKKFTFYILWKMLRVLFRKEYRPAEQLIAKATFSFRPF